MPKNDFYERIPTGVADFDSIINGGLPSGSVVLLIGDVGGGQHEFVYTSACKLSMVLDYPDRKRHILGDMCNEARVPDKICYVSISRTEEDILSEIKNSFHHDYHKALVNHLKFKDLSMVYFKNSVVPNSWAGVESIFQKGVVPKGDILTELVDFLDHNAESSMVVIDSLTHLAETGAVPMKDLVATLRGLQRVSKRWGGVVYLLLTQGILDKKEEQMIIDSVDGVIVFQWSKNKFHSLRSRYMYVEKFMSILPHLDEKRIARFSTIVNATQGLVVVNTEKIA